jgi:ADP-heptose:LPS heptosyltransferase
VCNIKDVLKSFRKYLAKKIFDKKDKSGKTFDVNKVKSVLFFRNDDKIGDVVVSTLLFREIKKQYSDIEIIVLCGKNNREIIKYNNNVEQIYEVGKSIFKDILIFLKLRKQNVSLAVDFYPFRPRFKHLLMLRIIAPKFLVGFYKSLYNIYDFSIDVNFFDIHISKRYEYLLKILKIENPDLKYDIVLSSKEEIKVLKLIENLSTPSASNEEDKIIVMKNSREGDTSATELPKHDKQQNFAKNTIKKYSVKYKIVLNPFAASKHRSFEYYKLKELINIIEDKIDCCVFMLCQKKNKQEIKSLENNRTFAVCFESVLESAALIRHADLVISPDTSIVHIAAAFNKKIVALYLNYSNTYEKIDIIWGPNNPNSIQLSVNTKNSTLENDIKNIPNVDILNALQKLLKGSSK